jgi:nicotinamide-nucleotide adenylyltransferase
MKCGMIHGRFQPFHNGHLEYLRDSYQRVDRLVIGITNPDPSHARFEPDDPQRHLAESNPFSYLDRLRMVKAVLDGLGVPHRSADVVPFPISTPELWSNYLPLGATHFVRVFSDWGLRKAERLRAHGFDVVVLDEGAEKAVSGAHVRSALRRGSVSWRTLVPAEVARLIEETRAYSEYVQFPAAPAPH